MTKSKIGFVIGSLRSGGAERVITILANSLSSEMDVFILTFKDVQPFYELYPNIRVIPYAKDYDKPRNLWSSIQLNVKLTRFLIQTIKKEGIQLAIGFITMSNILTTIAGKFTGIPVIISERNNPKYEATAAFWKFLRKYVYGSASILVVQTDAVKKFYLPFIKHKKIRVIPNPISESLSQQRKLDSTKERIILNVGRFTWQKNQKMLIRAFSKIAPMDWKLVIVGKGKLENELKNEIEASGLSHSIELKGPNSEIHEMYNRAGIFAFPSRFEGFPNALLEALHFGIPSISTDCPYGPSELIKSCENGFLIESDNQVQLEEMLKLLIEDQTLRDLMSRNAIESTESFRESKIIEIWNSLFKEFLTQPE